MKCALETWWGGHNRWQRCGAEARHGAYCVAHDWANTFKPFWDAGSSFGGSLIHRTRQAPRPDQPKEEP